MYADVHLLQGATARVEEGLGTFRTHLVESVQRQPGFRGAYALLDRERGTLVAITLWHTRHDLQANAALVTRPAGYTRHGIALADLAGRVYDVVVAPPTRTGISPTAVALR